MFFSIQYIDTLWQKCEHWQFYLLRKLASFQFGNRKTPCKERRFRVYCLLFTFFTKMCSSFDHGDPGFWFFYTRGHTSVGKSNEHQFHFILSFAELIASSLSDKGLSAGGQTIQSFYAAISEHLSKKICHIDAYFSWFCFLCTEKLKLRKRRTLLRWFLGKVAAWPPAGSLLCLLSHAAFWVWMWR